jgi:hypothetical protein
VSFAEDGSIIGWYKVSTEVLFDFRRNLEFFMKFTEFDEILRNSVAFLQKNLAEFRKISRNSMHFCMGNSVCTVLYGLTKFPLLYC